MRLHRLIAILLLVESRGKMKAKDLAAALETSIRSIYRDIDTLAEAGIPMVTSTGPSGGISLMEGYTVNMRQMNGEEVVQLYLTGMGIHSEAHSESRQQLKNALLKLEKTLPAAYIEDIRKAKTRFYFDDTTWWSDRLVLPCLEVLRAAVWRSSKVRIGYQKMNGHSSTRTVHPYGLVVKQGEWYLIAYCEEKGEIRTFKCERVVTVEVIDEEGAVPAGFSLEAFWRNREEAFKQACKAEERYPVVLRTDKSLQEISNELEVIEIQEHEPLLLLTANMYSYERACELSLTLLGHAEILEPAVLREYIKDKLRLLNELYN